MSLKYVPKFKKSSFSDERTKSVRCVEVSIGHERVFVRHSQRPSNVLEFNYGEWEAFLLGVKNNEFNIQEGD